MGQFGGHVLAGGLGLGQSNHRRTNLVFLAHSAHLPLGRPAGQGHPVSETWGDLTR